jgi:hypothetical protein
MMSWIIFLAVVTLFVLAVRHGRPTGPELPQGYDRERQLAELRAMTAANTHGPLLP